MTAAGAGRRALLISENAPVPGDRRVWNQSQALVAAGWSVAVVCAAAADREGLRSRRLGTAGPGVSETTRAG